MPFGLGTAGMVLDVVYVIVA